MRQKLANFSFAILLGAGMTLVGSAQSAKDDIKDAGSATKKTAKKTGRKVKHGTKKVTNKAAEKTEEGADRVRQKTDDNGPKR